MNPLKIKPSLLDCLVNPRGVAIIGASDNPNKPTARPFRYLKENGFAAPIYAVNPTRETIFGEKAYKSIKEIDEAVDHVYIMLSSDAALDALEECGARGVSVATILADGFAEAGITGDKRQKRLVEIIRRTGIRVLGPNSMGVTDLTNNFICTTNASFMAPPSPPSGRFAVLSQSGSLIGGLLSRGEALGVNFSTLIAMGNESDLDLGQVGLAMLDHPETDAFILFLETIHNMENFCEFAAAAKEHGKPIIVYKLGRSLVGQQLAVSHTGAMIGSDAAVDCFFKQLGVYRVNQFETLLELPPLLLSMQHSINNREIPANVTVISATGGGGALVVDNLAANGVEIKSVSEQVRKNLQVKGIRTGNSQLVDVTLAGANYETMKTVVSEIMLDETSGVVVVVLGSSSITVPEATTLPIIDAVRETDGKGAQLIVFMVPEAKEAYSFLKKNNIITMRSPEVCAEVIKLALSETKYNSPHLIERDSEILHLISEFSNATLLEFDCGQILDRLSIDRPKEVFTDISLSSDAISKLKFPVVAKVVSRKLSHKTEAGGVSVNINDVESLRRAIDAIVLSVEKYDPNIEIEGILVQEMMRGTAEVMIGMTRDPNVGPTITLAVGGILAEVYNDYALRMAPVTAVQAYEMIDEVPGLALIRGYRGTAKGDIDALAQTIVALSTLAQYDVIDEAEINPLVVMEEGQGVCAVDCLIQKAT